jgi:thioester reductase-like protein
VEVSGFFRGTFNCGTHRIASGYGASKFVAEHLVANSGLEGCSFRIGQICGGSATGAWATTDWFPILVKSSVSLGMLPDSPGVSSALNIIVCRSHIAEGCVLDSNE